MTLAFCIGGNPLFCGKAARRELTKGTLALPNSAIVLHSLLSCVEMVSFKKSFQTMVPKHCGFAKTAARQDVTGHPLPQLLGFGSECAIEPRTLVPAW